MSVPTISLCMIVKDEADNLPKCLSSVSSVVDQIVIVDTGSRDNTVELAKAFNAEVHHFPWTDSFSEARNYSLSFARCDWVLILDADDELDRDDIPSLKRIICTEGVEAYFLHTVNLLGINRPETELMYPTLRLFRNRDCYRYTGRIHESVIPSIIRRSGKESLHTVDVKVKHTGYLKREVFAKNKTRRNINLLLKEKAECRANSFLYYNLAVEYLRLGENKKALNYFNLAEKDIQPYQAFAPSLVKKKADCLVILNRKQEAADYLQKMTGSYPDYTDLYYQRGMLLFERQDFPGALEAFEKCLLLGEAPSRYLTEKGTGSFRACYALASVYEYIADTEKALIYYHRALSLNPKWLSPLGKIFLIQLKRRGIKETLAYLDTHFNLANAAANLSAARMIQEEGYPQEALHYILEAIKSGASGEDAVVFLGETQLLCKDYDAAEVNLSKVSSGNIYYPQARRNLCLLYWVTGQNARAFSLVKNWPKELVRELYIAVHNRLTGKNSRLPNPEFLLTVSASYLELLDKCLYTDCQSLKKVLLKFAQNVTEMRSAIGRLLFKHHMADEAQKWLERGSLMKDTEGALLLTRIYIQKKEDQLAFDCCRQILNANPSKLAVYFELADIYRMKAKEAMAQLAGLSPVIKALEGRQRPLLSLCMIVKDEAGMLPGCLKSVREIVDEIIIVDTGSVDDSPKIALEYGARIFHFPWQGDFSAARNYALEQASGDWVLMLDADEELHEDDGAKVKALLSSDAEGFCFQVINYYGDSAGLDFMRDLVCRLFRNRPEYRYRRSLHEQVVDEIAAKAGKNAVKVANVRINHYGYLNQVIAQKNKSKRNLEIIRRAAESNPEDKFLSYSLAVELLNKGKFAEALPLLEQVYQPQLSYSSDVALKQAVCLKELKRYDEALAAIDGFLGHYPEFTDLVFLQGEILMEKKAFLLAIDSFQRCLAIGDAPINYCGTNGAGSFRAYYCLGRAFEETGDFARAADAYKNAAGNNAKFHLPLYALTKLIRRTQTAAETAKIIETSFDISGAAALILLADIFISTKDFRQALCYLERFTNTQNPDLTKRVTIMKDHCLSHLGSAKEPAISQKP